MSSALYPMLHAQQLYHLNYLRFARKHVEAISTAQLGLKMRSRAVDINFEYNFLAQLKTAQLELKPVGQDKPQVKILRRALVFNHSPEDKKRTAIGSVSAVKNTASKVKQSAKRHLDSEFTRSWNYDHQVLPVAVAAVAAEQRIHRLRITWI